MARPYLQRLRELHKRLRQEQDISRRVEILDRMLFVIEAQLRSHNRDEASIDFHEETRAIDVIRRTEQEAAGIPPLARYLYFI
jgi:hypothetical protein